MNRALTIFGALIIAASVSGCGFDLCWDSWDDCDGWDCGDNDWYSGCWDDSECSSSESCIAGSCQANATCGDNGSCPSGFSCHADSGVCLRNGDSSCEGGDCPVVCAPGEVRFCDTPTYCSWGEQTCTADGSGWSECFESSPPDGCGGWGYDQECCLEAGGCCQDYFDHDSDGDRDESIGNCEPLPEVDPCPDGTCGCDTDAECAEGMMCIASLCADPASVCVFDFECGDGGACVDNECHQGCDAGCPVGQECSGDLCVDAAGDDGCVYDEDCCSTGAFACIDATCHPVCASSSDCGDGETCFGGACRADSAPVRQCEDSGDCPEYSTCERGVCRLPCAADVNCSAPLSQCGPEGFCVDPSEAAPACFRSTDCAGSVCRNGQCL